MDEKKLIATNQFRSDGWQGYYFKTDGKSEGVERCEDLFSILFYKSRESK